MTGPYDWKTREVLERLNRPANQLECNSQYRSRRSVNILQHGLALDSSKRLTHRSYLRSIQDVDHRYGSRPCREVVVMVVSYGCLPSLRGRSASRSPRLE